MYIRIQEAREKKRKNALSNANHFFQQQKTQRWERILMENIVKPMTSEKLGITNKDWRTANKTGPSSINLYLGSQQSANTHG